MGKITSITSKYIETKELLIWKSLLAGLVLLLIYQLINGRDLVSLLLLIGGAWVIVLCYYFPMPAIFIIMLLSTNILMFVDTTYFPHWQVMAGLRITVLDGLMVIMLFISLYKLQKRGEYPIFLKQILLVAGAVVIPFIAFLLIGETNLDIGMNHFRIMFIYAFYFILAGNIDSPKRLKILIGMIFLISFVSVVLQTGELIMGRRILIGNMAPGSIYSNSIVSVGDEIVPYLWNRAIIYLSLGLFLGLGGYFSGKNRFIFLTATLLGVFGIIATLNRAWFIAMVFGTLIFILMQKKLELRDLRRLIIMIIGLACLVLLISILSKSSYGSFIDIWFERIKTIQRYKETTFASKLDVWRALILEFIQSPIFGYGMTEKFENFWSLDTGLPNTLLQFGIVGLSAIIVLIANIFIKGYKLWQFSSQSIDRKYVAAILGFISGTLLMYFFTYDMYTGPTGIWGVTLAMAIIDRIWFFNSNIELKIR